MLGLASTVSSGSLLESLYSITLDGSDDYIDLGTGISLGTGDFTISLWVKTADFHDMALISEFEAASPQDFWYFGASNQNPPRLFFRHRVADDDAVNMYTGSSISLDDHKNAWTHIVISADRNGKIVGYVNGVADSADVDAAGSVVDLTIPTNTHIGNFSITVYYDFQIAELAIWNVPLDGDAVTAIYNSGKPTNLTFDSGNYDNSSALQAYYRMGNGLFDDKANGVIHDQHGGVELVTDGPFTNGTVSWNENSNWTYSNGTAVTDGTDPGDTSINQSGVMVIGRTYVVSYEIISFTSGPGCRIRAGSGTAYSAARTTVGVHSFTQVCAGNSSIYVKSDNSVCSIDNVSVFEISSGFGNEIFANGWDTLNLGSPAVNSNGQITVETNHSGLLHKTGHVSDGDVYKVVMDLETYTGGKIYVGGTQVTPTLGLNTYYIRSAGTNTGFGINDPNNFVASNLSVKKLNGIPGLTSDADVSGFNFTSDTP